MVRSILPDQNDFFCQRPPTGGDFQEIDARWDGHSPPVNPVPRDESLIARVLKRRDSKRLDQSATQVIYED